jgi:hypothetical protein
MMALDATDFAGRREGRRPVKSLSQLSPGRYNDRTSVGEVVRRHVTHE